MNEIPYKTGLRTFVVLMPDRPLKSVQSIVDKYSANPHVYVQSPSLPIMSPEYGQQWTRARNESMAIFDELGLEARWHANHDDDWLYGPGWDEPTAGLRALLLDEQWLSLRAVSLFVWGQDQDGVAQVNTRQMHYSPLFGRYETGWRYDPKMTNQIPVEVERMLVMEPERETTLPFFIMDCGTISDAERRRLYCEYANAGKMDDYTRRYINMPKMVALPKILKRYPNPLKYWEMQIQRWVRGKEIKHG